MRLSPISVTWFDNLGCPLTHPACPCFVLSLWMVVESSGVSFLFVSLIYRDQGLLSGLTFLPACHFYPFFGKSGVFLLSSKCDAFFASFILVQLNALRSSFASYHLRYILEAVPSLTLLVFFCMLVVLMTAPPLSFRLVPTFFILQVLPVQIPLSHSFLFLFPPFSF